jgi:hypothetical protein
MRHLQFKQFSPKYLTRSMGFLDFRKNYSGNQNEGNANSRNQKGYPIASTNMKSSLKL